MNWKPIPSPPPKSFPDGTLFRTIEVNQTHYMIYQAVGEVVFKYGVSYVGVFDSWLENGRSKRVHRHVGSGIGLGMIKGINFDEVLARS